jgi:hypothetical protein
LTLNSSWEIDQFHRKRSGLNADAVANVIEEGKKQIKMAIKDNAIQKNEKILKICIWHHSIQHHDSMKNSHLIDSLKNYGVKICCHGDIHEHNRDIFKYYQKNKMHVIGGGSFGSFERIEFASIPRLYNLIEIKHDLSTARIHTRCQTHANGPWGGWHQWPMKKKKHSALAYYDIKIS